MLVNTTGFDDDGVVSLRNGKNCWAVAPEDDELAPGSLVGHWVEREASIDDHNWATAKLSKLVRATWMPQEGSQAAFLGVYRSGIFEALYEGTRGPGKTDSLLMDFLQHVGRGYGAEWRGILFRKTFPELQDVVTKSRKWFKLIYPKAKYNAADHVWTFPGGEQLLFRHFRVSTDYESYHGHAYPWIAWEELCNWEDDKCYKVMMSCSRSTKPGMPRCYRATTNPYGPGHNWVKDRFRLPQSRGIPILDDVDELGHVAPARVAIHGRIQENRILLAVDPDYINKIRTAARNPSELAAWLEGSWDILAGGMFDDLWKGQVHVVKSVPPDRIPKGWKIDRAFDWGSSKPFSVGWFAESNGEPFTWNGITYGRVRGDVYQIAEYYGWNGNRNEGIKALAKDVAIGIRDRESDWGIAGRVKPGPADASIHDEENGKSIEGDMKAEGVRWALADKGPGSRKQGWLIMRKFIAGALPDAHGRRESPGFYVMDCCRHSVKLIPGTQRDEKDLDDVDTESEDHLQDMIRYRLRKKVRGVKSSTS